MIGILVTLLTYIGMEGVTWCTHKFVMHGSMWYFHEDHHQPTPGFFEKNDVFFLIYAVPSWLLIMFGMMNGNDFRTFIGLGILAYGIGYFLVHEVLIHRRFSWFDKTDNLYFRAIRKAHKVHHKNQFKEEAECFGMLVVPFKYFKAEQRFKQAKASK